MSFAQPGWLLLALLALLLASAVTMLATLAADVPQRLIDPRLRG